MTADTDETAMRFMRERDDGFFDRDTLEETCKTADEPKRPDDDLFANQYIQYEPSYFRW